MVIATQIVPTASDVEAYLAPCSKAGDPDAYGLEAVGGSKKPEVRDGDKLIVSPHAVWQEGYICIARTDHGATVERPTYVRARLGPRPLRKGAPGRALEAPFFR